MKDIYKEEEFEIPEGVSVSIKSRLITVKGPRGELTKSLRHIDMEIKKVGEKKIKLVVWHGARKHVACLRTVRSLITNMMNGVTKVLAFYSCPDSRGSDTKCVMSTHISQSTSMSLSKVSSHVYVNLTRDGKAVEIRNFLGEKYVRRVALHPGVIVTVSTAVKDELILEGESLDNVSQSAASIQQICLVRNKEYLPAFVAF
jgi:large subunit ribosomal protein L9e